MSIEKDLWDRIRNMERRIRFLEANAEGGGGGAPTDATYVTGAAEGGLSDELVLGTAVIMRGLAAARPAAGTAGRIYIETDGSYIVYRDNGAGWDEIARGEAGIRLAQLAEKAHASLTGVSADQHHTGFIGLEDNAGAAISPEADDRIQVTDDGIVNADENAGKLDLSVDPAQIDLDDLGNVETAGKAHGNVLIWDAVSLDWVNWALGLIDLSDVDNGLAPNDGDVLTYDSGDSEWEAAAPTSTGAWVLIEEHEVPKTGEASFTISSIPGTYRHLVIIGQFRTEVSGEDDNIGIQFNGDTGNNYDWAAWWVSIGVGYGNAASRGTDEILTFKSEAAGSRSNMFAAQTVWIYDYAETDREKMVRNAGCAKLGNLSANSDIYLYHFYGHWRSTSAITSILFRKYNTGYDIAEGSKVQVYGVL